MAPCPETPNCVAYSNTLREANQEQHEAAFAGKTSASWKRGENVENRYTWARFAQNIPRNLRVCATELGSAVCARKVQSADSHHPRIFLRKHRILSLLRKPSDRAECFAQTSPTCSGFRTLRLTYIRETEQIIVPSSPGGGE